MININNLVDASINTEPFDHIVVDNFFYEEYANVLSNEFPAYTDQTYWHSYNNSIEIKRTCNAWDRFPRATYSAFWYMCSEEFSTIVGNKFNTKLIADIGLNGGGWHMHGKGGKLNVHKDYSMHPKIPFQRSHNIIIHLSKDWNPNWGGALELWTHDATNDKPKECVKTIDIKYNRAIIFNTAQNSWHGLPTPLTCPEDVFRKTLAIYYVKQPEENVELRYRALFAPTKEQELDKEVLTLIEKRKG
jgi:hypothetical protein